MRKISIVGFGALFLLNTGLSLFVGVAGAAGLSTTTQTRQPAVAKPSFLWSGDEDCEAPESVYFHAETGLIFVSNISGAGKDKDGKGWIQKRSASGKVLARKWVKGLNAPKGMRAHGGVLWVSDIDEVVSIEIATGRILSKIQVRGSNFLNDVATDSQGNVYVSDTLGGKVYRVSRGKVEVFLSGDHLESPNGLLVEGNSLYVAAWGLAAGDFSTKVPGRLYKVDLQSKRKTLITEKPFGNLDGLEFDHRGDFLISDWKAGKVFWLSRDGKKSRVLLEGFKGAADIAYVQSRKTLIVPRMKENLVTAYRF